MNTSVTPERATHVWPVAQLRPHPHNPRGPVDPATVEELADSIRAQGILQPLLVTPRGVVVAGHRRLAAAQLVGLAEVPVIVRALDAGAQQEIMLVENLQREGLSVVQEARAYQRLVAGGYSQADIARRVGVNTQRIAARLELLRLDPEVQGMFDRGDLPVTLGPVLLDIKNPARQRQAAVLAARRGLTVAQLRTLVDRGAGALGAAPPPTPLPPDSRPAGGLGLSPSRLAALDALGRLHDRRLTLGELGDVFRDVCCACGMADLPAYCSGCPLVDFASLLVRRAERAAQAA